MESAFFGDAEGFVKQKLKFFYLRQNVALVFP